MATIQYQHGTITEPARTGSRGRPLRILIAIGVSRSEEAGAAGVVLNQARELQKLGHIVECWFLQDILHKPARPARFEALFFAFGVARRIRHSGHNFDVVNLHAPWGCGYGLQRRLGQAKDGPPYVLTMQGSEERYVVAMRAEQRKRRATNFAWKNRAWHRLYHQTLYSISIRTADYGMVANREALLLAELKYGHKPGRFWFVPNGVEERFFINRNYKESRRLKLLFVGTWLDRKGIFYLADSFARIAGTFPEVELTVAGTIVGASDVLAFFPAGLHHRVHVLPFISREAMPQLYAGHDVFVFPSLMEGMPLTLLEAMATGMPVVTTNCCGMADIVQDEFNGSLVPPADAESTARATERLCASVCLRESFGRAAQETMRRYTWAAAAKQMERVLHLAAEVTLTVPHEVAR